MNPTAILSSIWRSLYRVMSRLGRWVLERIAKRGVARIADYLEERAAVIAQRKTRVRTELRKRWLTARIKRWRAAAQWLRGDQGCKLQGEVIDLAVERAKQELPPQAIEESFERWKRAA